MKMKKMGLCILSTALMIGMLSGCGKGKDEAEAPTYELKAYEQNDETLPDDWYFVMDGDKVYPVSSPNKTSFNPESGIGEIATTTYVYSNNSTTEETEETEDGEAPIIDYDYVDDPTRILMYNAKDVCIPTLYKDQQLVFKGETVPDTFYIERFKDEGWSIGMYNLETIDSGKVQGIVNADNFFSTETEDSDFHAKLKEVEGIGADTILIFDTVNGAAISGDNVSEAGFIKGLQQDQGYPVRVYKGSDLISLDDVKADIHYYTGFERYAFNTYTFGSGGYISLQLPSTLPSGYYYINGKGMFRYINDYASNAVKPDEIDFNAPYYYTDENGITYINTELSATTTTEEDGENTTVETNNQDGTVYTSTFSIDSSLKEFTIEVTYEDATTKVNGETMQLTDAEVGLPSAKVIDPDGKEYLLEESGHKLSYTFEGANMGDYTIEVYNCSQRIFNISTIATTGNSDTLIHTGNGPQSLEYYLKNSYKNGIFTISWENTSHAADIVIEGPDGTKYGKSINESQIVKDDYGLIQIQTGEVKYGTYTITVTGEDLGRVLVSAAEAAQDANEVTSEETTETSEEGENTEETTEGENTEEATEETTEAE